MNLYLLTSMKNILYKNSLSLFCFFLFATLFFTGLSTHKANAQFRTTWITNDGTITIPTVGSSGSYNYDITWTNLTSAGVGNGSITARTGDYTITGLTNGHTYQVEITGTFPHIRLGSNIAQRPKLRTIER